MWSQEESIWAYLPYEKNELRIKFDNQDTWHKIPDIAEFNPKTDKIHFMSPVQFCVVQKDLEIEGKYNYFMFGLRIDQDGDQEEVKIERKDFAQGLFNMRYVYGLMEEIPGSKLYVFTLKEREDKKFEDESQYPPVMSEPKDVFIYKQEYSIASASWTREKHLNLSFHNIILPYSKPEDVD